jgi:hypothetical protein
MGDESVRSKFPVARWEVGGENLTFQVVRVEEVHTNRIVEHERPYRDGAKLDHTGPKAKGWRLTAIFINEEGQLAGIDDVQYPDNVDKLCDSFDKQETGTLTVPTRGPRRCKAESYQRVDDTEMHDSAHVVFAWKEDNEDDEAQQAYTSPSGKSALSALAAEVVEAATDAGVFNEDLQSFTDYADELADLANAPGDYVNDLEAQANAFKGKCENIEKSFTKAGDEAFSDLETLLTDPANSRAIGLLREAADDASRLVFERAGVSTRAVVTRTYNHIVSIVEVATDVHQPVEGLMILNSNLDDLLAIPPKTPIRIYDDFSDAA